jgi:capsular exopolysaccharide synthesis family protein
MSEELFPIRPISGDASSVQAWDERPVAPAPPRPPLERPIAAVRRYKFLIVAIVLIASAGGLVASRLVVPMYEVQTTIWIESQTPTRAGPIRSAELLNDEAWVELLRSYRIADAVVRNLTLYLTPEKIGDRPLFAGFGLADRFVPGNFELVIDRSRKRWTLTHVESGKNDAGAPGDSVGRVMGFHWVLPSSAFSGTGERKVSFTVSTPRETAVQLTGKLSTNLAQHSNFLWVKLQDRDPKLAERTLNTWVDEYVRVAGELKKKNVVEYANLLTEQVQFAEKSLHDAEANLENFRIHTITLPAEGAAVAPGVEATRDPVMRAFFEKRSEYDNLRHDVADLEKTIADATNGTTRFEAALLISSVATSPGGEALRQAFGRLYETQAKLVAARQAYTDDFPIVRDLKTSLNVLQTETIPQMAKQLLAQLQQRLGEYDNRIAGASEELKAIPTRTIEEMRLRRAVMVAEGLYTSLKSSAAAANLAAASAQPDINILDSAVAPLRPTRNTTSRMLMLAVMGGLGAAFGLALLLDMVDRRIRYPDQATDDLGLVIAGAVPRIPKGGLDDRSPEQLSQLVESFRSLRMHVTQSGQPPLALAISSPQPGDGKSLVSANLAMSFAEAGFRTVLVDGDTRRGALQEMFGIPKSPGLTEYLLGQADVSAVVYSTPHSRLSLVPSGKRDTRSPELLASASLVELVNKLRGSFDVLVFDTPPLAAGIDAYALSAAAGKLLLVLRIGKTERRLAAAKLAVVDRLPIEVLGAVLNDVDLNGEYQYYGYASGYELKAEEEVEVTARLT